MTAPSVEMAESPPTSRPLAVTRLPAGDRYGSQGRAPLARAALRSERRIERRRRLLYAIGGLSVLAGFLAATVVVLDVVR